MSKATMDNKFAVLGSPIAHSKSSLIHAAAYRVLGENWDYSRFEVAKGGLKRFVENDGAGFTGCSLTMPLKEEAFSFADVTDDISSGAAMDIQQATQLAAEATGSGIRNLTGTIQTAIDLIQSRRSLRVEWYIVILIVVEIVLTLYDMFIRGR